MVRSFTILVALLFIVSVGVQAQAFEQGTKVVSAGIGIGSSLGSSSYTNQSPGISLLYEQGMWEVGGPGAISLGGYLGFKNFKQDYSSSAFSSSAKWNYTIVGVRSAYHYNGLGNPNLDLYGGLMFSYNILNYTYEHSGGQNLVADSGSSSAGITLYVGGRYYFVENLGIFTELGYGISYLNIGLALRL
ncbi:MAG TPA: hypothetical protein VK014_00990 [Cyclobacteriaceae bacterium]|nr:hypothetical protein [Cyclobacteriaceae bacterium]